MEEISFDRVKLRDVEQRFIATFFRFEFALKERGFHPKEDGDARVGWDQVAEKLGEEFYEKVKQSKEVETLLNLPPKKQVIRNGSLRWAQQKAPSNIGSLLLAIRRVRNNLFHCDKSGHPDSTAEDFKRNITLVAEAQWVIEQAIHHLPHVKGEFEGRY